MYKSICFYFGAVILSGCAQKQANNIIENPKNFRELHATVHGFDHWKSVRQIQFTFNVDRDTSHFERSWIWETQTNRVTRITTTDTISYLRSQVDSTLTSVDAGFINDKFWLLAPYQWIWDQKNITDTVSAGAKAPISGVPMDKLTVVYGNDGGYTPGDAYDFYIGRDSLVSEWVFRKGNQPVPSLATTWEGYETHGGLKLSTSHKNADGSFHLYFTGLKVQ
ncbi:MAG: hypothetical protein RLZZ241_1624 [Bacteroidota bacterium]|jgi:hypothetical protein